MVDIKLHRKRKIEQNDPQNKNRSELRYSGRVNISCSSSGNRRATVQRHEHQFT